MSTFDLHSIKDITPEELEEDEHICRVIASFKYIRCNFKKLARPEDYVYESLGALKQKVKVLFEQTFWNMFNSFPGPGLANRTAEKTKPSCLDYVLFFSEAVRLKKESEPHKSLRDCLWAAIQEYNKKNPKAWHSLIMQTWLTRGILGACPHRQPVACTLRTSESATPCGNWPTTWCAAQLNCWTCSVRCTKTQSQRLQARFNSTTKEPEYQLTTRCTCFLLWHLCATLPALSIENLDGDYFVPGSCPDHCEGVWKEAQAGWNQLKTTHLQSPIPYDVL